MKNFFENIDLSFSIITALITILPITFILFLWLVGPNKLITATQVKWLEFSKPTGYTYYKPMYKNKMTKADTTAYTLLKEMKTSNPTGIDCYIKLNDNQLELDEQRTSFCNLQVLDVLQAMTNSNFRISPSMDSDKKTEVKERDCITLLQLPQKENQTPIKSVIKGTRQGGWVYAALTDCPK